MNSYCRLLVHQIAEYHGLRHILANDGASVVVFKTFTPPNQLNIGDEAEKSTKEIECGKSVTDDLVDLKIKLADIKGIIINDNKYNFQNRGGYPPGNGYYAHYNNQMFVPSYPFYGGNYYAESSMNNSLSNGVYGGSPAASNQEQTEEYEGSEKTRGQGDPDLVEKLDDLSIEKLSSESEIVSEAASNGTPDKSSEPKVEAGDSQKQEVHGEQERAEHQGQDEFQYGQYPVYNQHNQPFFPGNVMIMQPGFAPMYPMVAGYPQAGPYPVPYLGMPNTSPDPNHYQGRRNRKHKKNHKKENKKDE